MKYEIVYLELALNDVEEIRDWLSQFYPGTPERFLSALKERIAALTEMPYLYAEYEDVPSYRRIVVSGYLVFYKVDEKRGRVEIHRVLHGARDTRRYLL